jgi:hypothetical protein
MAEKKASVGRLAAPVVGRAKPLSFGEDSRTEGTLGAAIYVLFRERAWRAALKGSSGASLAFQA